LQHLLQLTFDSFFSSRKFDSSCNLTLSGLGCWLPLGGPGKLQLRMNLQNAIGIFQRQPTPHCTQPNARRRYNTV
jgi:hypothetical protein